MPTKPDGSGLTNREQKIVRGFEIAVKLQTEHLWRMSMQDERLAADRAYDRARAKLVALIRSKR